MLKKDPAVSVDLVDVVQEVDQGIEGIKEVHQEAVLLAHLDVLDFVVETEGKFHNTILYWIFK